MRRFIQHSNIAVNTKTNADIQHDWEETVAESTAPRHAVWRWGSLSKRPRRYSKRGKKKKERKHNMVTAESPRILRNRIKRWPRKLLELPFVGLTPSKAAGKKGASLKGAVPKNYRTPSPNLESISGFFRRPAVGSNWRGTKIRVYTRVITILPEPTISFHCTDLLLLLYFLFPSACNYISTHAENWCLITTKSNGGWDGLSGSGDSNEERNSAKKNRNFCLAELWLSSLAAQVCCLSDDTGKLRCFQYELWDSLKRTAAASHN